MTEWYCCPHCGKRLLQIGPDTKVIRLPYKCKICKKQFEINIGIEPESIETGAIDCRS